MTNNRIRNIMAEQGITTSVLAKKIGMTPSGLNQHISGNPSIKTLEKIAEGLNVPFWHLFVSPKEISSAQEESNGDFAAFVRCNGIHFTADSYEEFKKIVEQINEIAK